MINSDTAYKTTSNGNEMQFAVCARGFQGYGSDGFSGRKNTDDTDKTDFHGSDSIKKAL
jgi:hypothetical protein